MFYMSTRENSPDMRQGSEAVTLVSMTDPKGREADLFFGRILEGKHCFSLDLDRGPVRNSFLWLLCHSRSAEEWDS